MASEGQQGRLAIDKGTVFWRQPGSQTVDTAGKPHHWVVLTDPVVVDGVEMVLWVPLSSFKPWLDASQTYRFNVGKSNRYIDARNDSCPFLKFAEVTTVNTIRNESPARHNRIRPEHVVGICKALLMSGDTPPKARLFYKEHGDRLD